MFEDERRAVECVVTNVFFLIIYINIFYRFFVFSIISNDHRMSSSSGKLIEIKRNDEKDC